MNQSALDQMIRETPGLWRGKEGQKQFSRGNLEKGVEKSAIDTGFAELNALLPTGGWPLRSIVEIQVACWGNGELQPLLPFIAKLTANQSRVAMIAPPYTPYAPALIQHGVQLPQLIVVDIASEKAKAKENTRGRGLTRRKGHRSAPYSRAKEIWWAAEKLLRHEACGMVLTWPLCPDAGQVRRLQLAADASNSIGVIFQSGETADTPVGLRLWVERCADGVAVRLLKSRYGWRQHGEVILPNSAFSGDKVSHYRAQAECLG